VGTSKLGGRGLRSTCNQARQRHRGSQCSKEKNKISQRKNTPDAPQVIEVGKRLERVKELAKGYL
jgi:hypothetical protein